MWAAIQSVYNGTWGGSAVPQEIVDFEMCQETHMSWSELQEMPLYVRRVWWDCIMAKREAQQEAYEEQNRKQGGTQRVRW